MFSPDVCNINAEGNCIKRIKTLYTHNHTIFKILICNPVGLLLIRRKNRLWIQCDKSLMNLEWVLCTNDNGFLCEKQWMHQYSLQCYRNCVLCSFPTFWKFATGATAHMKEIELFLQIIQQFDIKEAPNRTCFLKSGRQLSQFTMKYTSCHKTL